MRTAKDLKLVANHFEVFINEYIFLNTRGLYIWTEQLIILTYSFILKYICCYLSPKLENSYKMLEITNRFMEECFVWGK